MKRALLATPGCLSCERQRASPCASCSSSWISSQKLVRSSTTSATQLSLGFVERKNKDDPWQDASQEAVEAFDAGKE